MKKVVDKTVDFDLLGAKGDPLVITLGFVIRARSGGWTPDEINKVLREAQGKGYDHFLAVMHNHCNPKDSQ